MRELSQAAVDTELVRAARLGDHDAFAELFDRWFGSVWSVAYNIVRDSDLASGVAQDCFLVAWQQLGCLRDADAFGGWILRIGRNRSLNCLERERRSSAFDTDTLTRLGDGGARKSGAADPIAAPEQSAEARDRQELVWIAAAALGQRDWSLLDLHLRHGLAAPELAQELGIKVNNAHQLLHRLRSKLAAAIGAYLLWRHGRASCAELARLARALPHFDKSTAKVVAGHQSSCEVCDEQHRAVVDPEQLLAGLPLLLPQPEVVARAAADLQSAGVPTPGRGSPGRPSAGRPSTASPSAGSPSAGGGSDATAEVVPSHGLTARLGRRSNVLVASAVAVVVVVGLGGIAVGAGPSDQAVAIAAEGVLKSSEQTSTTSVPNTADGPGVAESVVAEPSEEALSEGDEIDSQVLVEPTDGGLTEGPGPTAVPLTEPEEPAPDVSEPQIQEPGAGTESPAEPDPDGIERPDVASPDGTNPDGAKPSEPPLEEVGPALVIGAQTGREAETRPLTFSVSLDGSGLVCSRSGAQEWEIVWVVEGATTTATSTFTLHDERSATVAGANTGRATFCALPGTAFTIEATDGSAVGSHQGATAPANESAGLSAEAVGGLAVAGEQPRPSS